MVNQYAAQRFVLTENFPPHGSRHGLYFRGLGFIAALTARTTVPINWGELLDAAGFADFAGVQIAL